MGMKELFADWRNSKAQEFESKIKASLTSDEKLVAWTFVFTAPNELMDWVPGLDTLYKLKRKDYILALTSKALVLIPLKKGSLIETVAPEMKRFEKAADLKLEIHPHWAQNKLSVSQNGQSRVYFKTELLEGAQELQQRLLN